MNGQIQKIETGVRASSKDLQVVSTKIALNYRINKDKANWIYQNLGIDFGNTIIAPAIQESVKSVTAQFTAEELITKRGEVSKSITESLSLRLSANSLLLDNVDIMDFDFSKAFNHAIEVKQVAEQKSLTAKNDLVRIQVEALQAKAKA